MKNNTNIIQNDSFFLVTLPPSSRQILLAFAQDIPAWSAHVLKQPPTTTSKKKENYFSQDRRRGNKFLEASWLNPPISEPSTARSPSN